jgi:hypothetical protein
MPGTGPLPPARADQARHALQKGNAKRSARAQLVKDVAEGKIDWRLIILEPPECIADLLLSEVLLMLPWMGRRRVERLGLLAHEFGITLTVRAGKSSRTTRSWVMRHTLPRRATGRRAVPRHGSSPRAARTNGVLLP